MSSSAAVRRTFPEPAEPLAWFVTAAIEGSYPDRLYAAVLDQGREASRQLLQHLGNLPKRAGCDSAEQFVIGFKSGTGAGAAAMVEWDALMAETFSLMMVDLKTDSTDPLEVGAQLIALIRKASDFASRRLRAWGV